MAINPALMELNNENLTTALNDARNAQATSRRLLNEIKIAEETGDNPRLDSLIDEYVAYISAHEDVNRQLDILIWKLTPGRLRENPAWANALIEAETLGSKAAAARRGEWHNRNH